MLANLLTSILRLMVFRAGPQDVPYSPQLLRFIIPVAVAIGWILFSVVLPVLPAAVMSIVNVLGTVLVAQGILRARDLAGRVPQTVTALVGSGIILNLLMIYPAMLLAPHIAEIAKHPELLKTGGIKLPEGPVLAVDGLNLWGFIISAYIYRHAANVRALGGIGFAILAGLVVLMLVLLAATFVSML
ncbi:MAG TPA: hypothetical protein VFQ88_03505 [Nevskiaceae bacterium]|nr:hypothetical protein [Nevskiaceae bacterium]